MKNTVILILSLVAMVSYGARSTSSEADQIKLLSSELELLRIEHEILKKEVASIKSDVSYLKFK